MESKGTTELLAEAQRAQRQKAEAGGEAPSRARATLLTGIHDRSFDEKGRVVIPAAMREPFQDGVAIVPWPGPCLALMPTVEFLRIERKLRRQQRDQLTDPAARFSLVARTLHAYPDGQGRLFIPETMREAAALPTDIAVVGQIRRIELWDRDRCVEKVLAGQAPFEVYAFTEAL